MTRRIVMNPILRFFYCVILIGLISACTESELPSTAAPETPTDSGLPPVDLVVEGNYVVSMDENQTVISNGAVAVRDGLIVALGAADEIAAAYTASETLSGDNRIVMPGLINGHSHAAMTLLRGVADDLALMDWLNNYIFPAEPTR